MPLLLVLWLQCQLPDSAAFPAAHATVAKMPRPMPANSDAAQAIPSEFARALLSCLSSSDVPVNQPDRTAAFSQYPEQIQASFQPDAATYPQKSGYYAIRLADLEAEPVDAVTVIRDEKGAIALFEGTPPVSLKRNGENPLPVYGSGDVAVVPTGEVFIRFKDGVDARDRATELEAVGYAITKILDFAPQAAWIHAISGETADSLQRLNQLEGLAGLENIEPQLLMKRQSR